MELISILVSGIVFPFIIHVGKRLGFSSKQSIAVVSLGLVFIYAIVDLVLSQQLKEETLQYIASILGVGNLIYIYILQNFFKEDLKKK